MFGKNDDNDEAEEPDPEPAPAEPAGDPEPDGPTTDELAVRLDELEEELSSTDSSIRSLRSSQEEMAETVAEVDDTVRQLLGVYDRLTAADNPFVDEPAGSDGVSGAEPTSDHAHVDAADAAGGDGADAARDDDAVVDFDDLAAEVDDPDGGPADAGDDFLWEGEPDAATEGGSPDEVGVGAAPSEGGGRVALSELPGGYAGDALVMEWLAMLVEEAGPAGTLRAIDYYEEVGWVAGGVRERLVDVLGGPDLDVHVDPNRPAEPSATEHTESYRYIETLDRLADI